MICRCLPPQGPGGTRAPLNGAELLNDEVRAIVKDLAVRSAVSLLTAICTMGTLVGAVSERCTAGGDPRRHELEERLAGWRSLGASASATFRPRLKVDAG